MNSRRHWNAIIAANLAVLAPICLAACSGPVDLADPTTSGTFSMPLITVTNGHRYRVKDAAITISGSTSAWLTSSDDPGETELSTVLQTGAYWAYLQSWTLERDDGTDTFSPVRANLISSNPNAFSIFHGTTTTISYRFETDGAIVVVGSGDLKVNIAVNELTPACTPLGTDCSSGSWCPPTGLTGLPLTCMAEGSVALGAPCLGPSDCVRNASCFDWATGAICAALCPVSEIGLPCSSGGTCQPGGRDYGVCTRAR
jgi:hypothetical protein